MFQSDTVRNQGLSLWATITSILPIDRLIVWCLMPFSMVFQLYPGGQSTYPCFSGVPFTSTPHNILSKPLTAFPHNHCWNNGQRWERNESCCNEYHRSSERLLAKPGIKPTTSCSQVRIYLAKHKLHHLPYLNCHL